MHGPHKNLLSKEDVISVNLFLEAAYKERLRSVLSRIKFRSLLALYRHAPAQI